MRIKPFNELVKKPGAYFQVSELRHNVILEVNLVSILFHLPNTLLHEI